jgi:hypothetical protein
MSYLTLNFSSRNLLLKIISTSPKKGARENIYYSITNSLFATVPG